MSKPRSSSGVLEPLAFLGAPVAGAIAGALGIGPLILPTPRGSPDVAMWLILTAALALGGGVLGMLAGIIATASKVSPRAMLLVEASLALVGLIVFALTR